MRDPRPNLGLRVRTIGQSTGHQSRPIQLRLRLRPPCRFILVIVALRGINPEAAILLSKFDFKSAYRLMHLHASSGLQSIVTITGLEPDPIALASLRVTFGGSPSSYLFAKLSESVSDPASVLVRYSLWDPLELPPHSDLIKDPPTQRPDQISPSHSDLIKAPLYQDDAIPLAPVRSMIVDPKVDKFGTAKVFIDDVFSACSLPYLMRASINAHMQFSWPCQ